MVLCSMRSVVVRGLIVGGVVSFGLCVFVWWGSVGGCVWCVLAVWKLRVWMDCGCVVELG